MSDEEDMHERLQGVPVKPHEWGREERGGTEAGTCHAQLLC